MKTLTALIIALASLSTVYASESETSDQVTVQLITVAMVDDTTAPAGECKAVCVLPVSFDRALRTGDVARNNGAVKPGPTSL